MSEGGRENLREYVSDRDGMLPSCWLANFLTHGATQAANSYVRAIDAAALTAHLWTPALAHLGRLLLEDNQPATAVDFFQRAVASPAPDSGTGRSSSLPGADDDRDGGGGGGGWFFEQPQLRWVNPLVARSYVQSLRTGSLEGLGRILLSQVREVK